jgi:hypothetical protein
MACNDAKHFEMKESDAKRIASNLANILSKYGNVYSLKMCEQEDMRHRFDFDHQHLHFMCGSCYKVNKQSLTNAERDIVDNLLKFVMLFKTDKAKINDVDYHTILRNLQGYYPGMYHALEREWYNS